MHYFFESISSFLTSADLRAELLSAPLQVTVLLAVCAVGVLVLRHRSASLAHRAWAVGLLGVLLVPACTICTRFWAIPVWSLPGSAAESIAVERVEVASAPDADVLSGSLTEATAATFSTTQTDGSGEEAQLTNINSDQSVATRMVGKSNPQPGSVSESSELTFTESKRRFMWSKLSVFSWLWILWVTVTSCLMLRVAIAAFRLFKNVHSSRVADSAIQNYAEEIALALGLAADGWRVRIDEKCRMPVAFWCGHWTVVLPSSAASWDREMLRSVLTHELGHVVRRDALVDFVGQLACCIHWFNPFVWLATADTRRLREQACDDLVLSQPAMRRHEYARHLLDVVAECVSPKTQLASAIAGSNAVESRIRRIVGRNASSPPSLFCRRLLTLAIVACVVGASLFRLGESQEAARPVRQSNEDNAVVVDGTTLNVRGRVLSPAGKPVAGAEVVLKAAPNYFGSNISNKIQTDVIARTRSDVEGHYRFSRIVIPSPYNDYKEAQSRDGRSPFDVIASAPNLGLTWATVDPAIENELDLPLKKQGILEGQVLSESGKPLAGAIIKVTSVGDLKAPADGFAKQAGWLSLVFSDLSPTFKTKADGRFRLEGLPTDHRFSMSFSHPRHVDSYAYAVAGDHKKSELEMHGETVDLLVSPLELKLKRGYAVELTVTDADGKPAQGKPDMLGGARMYTLNRVGDGRYAGAVGEVGTYSVHFRDRSGLGAGRSVTFDNEHRDKPQQLAIKLPKTRTVTGFLRAMGTDEGVPGVAVSWSNGGQLTGKPSFYSSSFSDDSGRFRIEVVPGKGRLTLSGKAKGVLVPDYSMIGRDSNHFFNEIEIAETGKQKPIVVEISRGLIVSGTVTDPDGKPVVGASLRIEGRGRGWSSRGEATTDKDGRYELAGLNPRFTHDVIVIGHDAIGTAKVIGIDDFPYETPREETADVKLTPTLAVTGQGSLSG